ncbi:predicted protein [Plenodomus lingam JN3]|uniref:Predicted protein n=1 Tax=Leptosphaeria maculans (strain JN3 / isolate v23.1.3 / race Av1-4-5-6-7-8) TaxID=985895 RepID=E4ZUR1_LEPMJ|nr:predicted protein [Plenodomus lingam JN3]CBX95140.1 predicted protein [Plenodomus lingam JN3]
MGPHYIGDESWAAEMAYSFLKSCPLKVAEGAPNAMTRVMYQSKNISKGTCELWQSFWLLHSI